MERLWTWMETLPVVEHIAISWWFPLLESVHVLAVSVLVGFVALLDLRLLGRSGRGVDPVHLLAELNPWALGALVLAVPSGLAMFATRASHYAANTAFRVKLLVLVLLALNLIVFQRRLRPRLRAAGAAQPPAVARAAGLSLLLWCAAVLAGRWIGHS